MHREQSKYNNSRRGVSLIELVIGIGVGAVLVASASMLISVALRISREDRFLQTASFLSQDLMDKVTVYADSLWYSPDTDNRCSIGSHRGLANLFKSPNITKHRFHLQTPASAQPFLCFYDGTAANAGEQIVIDGTTYTRYFYVEDVRRRLCGTGDITTDNLVPDCAPIPGNEPKTIVDPSTQKVTVVTSWPSGGNVTLVRNLTRTKNNVVAATDWSGGATSPSDPAHFATSTANTFFSFSGDIDVTGIPGSIILR
jgi:hypothetical protein